MVQIFVSKVNVVPSDYNISDKVRILVLILTSAKILFSLKNCLMNTEAIKKGI